MLGYLIIGNIERIFINYMAFLIRLFARFFVFELDNFQLMKWYGTVFIRI